MGNRNKFQEISENTNVKIGFVIGLIMLLVSAVLYVSGIENKVEVLGEKQNAHTASNTQEYGQLEKRLDRIEGKLDKVLEEKP